MVEIVVHPTSCDYKAGSDQKGPMLHGLKGQRGVVSVQRPMAGVFNTGLTIVGHRPDTNGSGSGSGHVVLIPKRLRLCACRRLEKIGATRSSPHLRTKELAAVSPLAQGPH